MKTLKNLFLAMLALSLLATPALAQKHSRSNRGGAESGAVRADAVQDMSTKQDKDRDPNTDNDKHGKHKGESQGKHKGNTQGKHTGRGHH